jgi:hypothetical protein
MPDKAENRFACPRNAAHNRAFALHKESVCHVFSTDDNKLTYIEDMRNTYEGEGYEGPLGCYECYRFDDVKTILVTDASDVIQ